MSDYNKFELDLIARLTEACAEKGKRITELEKMLRRSIAARLDEADAFMAKKNMQQQRLTEARGLILNMVEGHTPTEVLIDGSTWLEGKP